MKMKETYLQVDDVAGNGDGLPGAGITQDDGPAPRIKASEVVALARDMGVSKKKLIRALGFDRGEILRKTRGDEYLDERQSELFAHMLGIIATLNHFYFDGTHDHTSLAARREWAEYLDWEPFSLGYRPVSEFLRTIEGQNLVASEIHAGFYGMCL
ncbi:hypothetical protein [Cupriavidus pauculus]|uniref:DUF2384 domain-containing protein n=1 Tax=Cupriavidus pauculus TaxID=82633 RepID=A0A2N5CJZ4_9BURK|nr:hypothetical protein [Cupriavidus pauculus]PLQ02546.1 hypothetical protein CYJ10_04490 [Cupriavidus pauculus]